ncbi:unnamed protein product [Nesidiocoris tenuis]|uniref:Uncharacterized protein n=1 Tax=Nesidiocoris tenuis TaxID=355587 RepID=A0A6H5GGX5_9HEMI|nr:unnamed protein product [Nesidiocoris tenuis]
MKWMKRLLTFGYSQSQSHRRYHRDVQPETQFAHVKYILHYQCRCDIIRRAYMIFPDFISNRENHNCFVSSRREALLFTPGNGTGGTWHGSKFAGGTRGRFSRASNTKGNRIK